MPVILKIKKMNFGLFSNKYGSRIIVTKISPPILDTTSGSPNAFSTKYVVTECPCDIDYINLHLIQLCLQNCPSTDSNQISQTRFEPADHAYGKNVENFQKVWKNKNSGRKSQKKVPKIDFFSQNRRKLLS